MYSIGPVKIVCIKDEKSILLHPTGTVAPYVIESKYLNQILNRNEKRKRKKVFFVKFDFCIDLGFLLKGGSRCPAKVFKPMPVLFPGMGKRPGKIFSDSVQRKREFEISLNLRKSFQFAFSRYR